MLIRNSFLFMLVVFLLAGCDEINEFNKDYEQISLSTDRFSYTELDTINLSLENKSDFNTIIGLRCGSFLEMFYQRKKNNHWSDNLLLPWMFLRCPTFLETVHSNSTFAHSIPAEVFGSTGSFRLLVNYYVPNKDTSGVLISNSFEIK